MGIATNVDSPLMATENQMTEHQCKCKGENHPTYGACLRAKGLSFPGVFSSRSSGWGNGDRSRQQRWDRELAEFKSATEQGVLPAGTSTLQTRVAMELSDRTGKAYRDDSPTKFAS